MDFREVGDDFVALDGDTAYALEGPAAAAYRAGGLSRRRLLAAMGAGAAVAGVSAVVGPAAAAHASLITGNLVVTLNPTNGPDGKVVQVTVTNLPTVAGTAITTVSFGATPVSPSNTTVTAGTANFTITVPNNLAPGAYTVTVHDNHNNQGTATFTINAPSVTLTPNTVAKSGSPKSVSVSGSGFLPGDTVTITNTGIDTFTPTPNTLTANGSGQISGTISLAYGNGNRSGQLKFTDQHGNTASATITA